MQGFVLPFVINGFIYTRVEESLQSVLLFVSTLHSSVLIDVFLELLLLLLRCSVNLLCQVRPYLSFGSLFI